MSSSALVPYGSGREIGSPNAIGSAVASGILKLLESFGVIKTTPTDMADYHSMTTSQGAGITNYPGEIITDNRVAVTVKDSTGKQYKLETTITPTDQDVPELTEEQQQQFLINEIDAGLKLLNTTDSSAPKYIPPEISGILGEFIELLKSTVETKTTMAKLFEKLQNLTISGYVNKLQDLTTEQKTKVIAKSKEIFLSRVGPNGFIVAGTSLAKPTEFAETDRNVGNAFLGLVKHNKGIFTDPTNTRYDEKISGLSIELLIINFLEKIREIIKDALSELGLPKYLSGGSRQNKGMFNYAHFIPLRNRSKKHNYATKIKPNSRRHRRNKTSNKRRSRRS